MAIATFLEGDSKSPQERSKKLSKRIDINDDFRSRVNESIKLFYGRLALSGIASYKDIKEWGYSPQELLDMHEMLDIRDKMQQEQSNSGY